VPLSPADFAARLDGWVADFGHPPRLLLAYSGGRDSSVLLHLLQNWAGPADCPLTAIHVNHHLHDEASRWQAHCERVATGLGVPCVTLDVDVATANGLGLEANARDARYSALQQELGSGEWLLTAHHADDQAETVLLNLMRGSGVAGVRGVAAHLEFGRGRLLRPLLDASAADIADYARTHAIAWVDDHSNADQQHDRNYLRAAVLPPLRERWPAMAAALGKSASHATEAGELLDDLAALDLRGCGDAARLQQEGLQALSPPRRRNLIRFACRQLGLPTPPLQQLRAIQDELLPAKADAMPVVRWAGAEARRFRGQLYLFATCEQGAVAGNSELSCRRPLELGPAHGTLSLQASEQGGIPQALAETGLKLRYRAGGERLQPSGQAHHRRLKSLLQEAGVVPWMRDRIPLLYAADNLVAVGDLWIADEFHEAHGFRVVWQKRPAIF
jgi:tRNA(Ile)-lysidine synthase